MGPRTVFRPTTLEVVKPAEAPKLGPNAAAALRHIIATAVQNRQGRIDTPREPGDVAS